MYDAVIKGLEFLTIMLEIIGATALVVGFIVTTLQCFYVLSQEGLTSAIKKYRTSVGRVILIGLEILVAATIIKMLTLDETLMSVILLAIIVGIRIMIAWTTELEMYGKWPWQR